MLTQIGMAGGASEVAEGFLIEQDIPSSWRFRACRAEPRTGRTSSRVRVRVIAKWDENHKGNKACEDWPCLFMKYTALPKACFD
jgi:hypothetical protein